MFLAEQHTCGAEINTIKKNPHTIKNLALVSSPNQGWPVPGGFIS